MAENKIGRVENRRVQMANERTFLAWIRTSIGIMAFGFFNTKINSVAGCKLLVAG